MGKLFRRIHYLVNREALARELADEMSAHREMMSAERRGAFGHPLRFHDQSRDAWGWLWVDCLRQDLTFAMRGFRRDRRFTFSALAAIVLAVGLATAVFSVVDRSLFRPLPYRQGDRLVSIGLLMPHFGPGQIMFSGAYDDWRAAQTALDLACWRGVADCDLGGPSPQRLHCALAEAAFLPTLGVQPALGRGFSADEDRPGAPPVALLSFPLWRAMFGGDRTVLGKNILLDGTPTRIIGVLPAAFETPSLIPADLLLPQKLPPGKRNYLVEAIGRLRPGQSVASAAAALAGPLERFRTDFSARVGSQIANPMRLQIETLRDRQLRQYRLAFWVLLGAVAAFVLIACANVANLQLARSAGRLQEFAVRMALGGSRRRLVGQLLTENVLLACAGGAAGCGLACGLLRAFLALAPEGALRLNQARLDSRVLLFALLLSLAAALLFGLAPSLAGVRAEVFRGDRVLSRRPKWLQQGLIAGQLAVSIVLLGGSGLLLVSLWRLENVPLGFSRERVVTASFTLPAYRYGRDLRPTGWSPRQVNFFNQLEARLRDLPGAVAAAVTDSMPPAPAERTLSYTTLGRMAGKGTEPGAPARAQWRYVSVGYFEALGIPILRGRGFSDADRAPGARAVIVNESLARWLAGNGDPVGLRLGASMIVGVAADSRNTGLDRPVDPELYQVRRSSAEGIPGAGDDAWWRRATVIVRTRLADRDAQDSLKAAIRDLDPEVPVKLESLQTRVNSFSAKPRFQAVLLAVFAFTGLVLAGIGLYGLVSFLVAERTPEIGLRVAVGAAPRDIARMVLSDGARLTAIGIMLGIAGAATLLRLLKGLLYETGVLDWRVLACAIAVLTAVAVLATWLPARRASRIDPLFALRHE